MQFSFFSYLKARFHSYPGRFFSIFSFVSLPFSSVVIEHQRVGSFERRFFSRVPKIAAPKPIWTAAKIWGHQIWKDLSWLYSIPAINLVVYIPYPPLICWFIVVIYGFNIHIIFIQFLEFSQNLFYPARL